MGKIATAAKVSINRSRSPSPSVEAGRATVLSGRGPRRVPSALRRRSRHATVPHRRVLVWAGPALEDGAAAAVQPCGPVPEACDARARAAGRDGDAGAGAAGRPDAHARAHGPASPAFPSPAALA